MSPALLAPALLGVVSWLLAGVSANRAIRHLETGLPPWFFPGWCPTMRADSGAR